MSGIANKKPSKGGKNARKPKIKTKVLFVCTGNTCRSPMAEYIFKSYVKRKRKSSLFDIGSAGISACGEPMTENALGALRALGIAAKQRNSVRLTYEAALQADLIVCMTSSHARVLEEFGDKVTTVAALTGGPEVDDPFGGDLNTYVKTAEYLLYAADDCFEAAVRISRSKQK